MDQTLAKKLFRKGEVLLTLIKKNRFQIEDIGDDGILVKCLDRDGEPSVTLKYRGISRLLNRPTALDGRITGCRLLGGDTKNESQYFALVSEAHARLGLPEQIGPATRQIRHAIEGSAREFLSRSRRRSVQLRQAKLAVSHLQCRVCKFDFERTYGPLGAGFAHVHHTRPLATRNGGGRTELQDLAVLCANCHAMVHRGGGCRSIGAVRAAMKAARR